ncbi:hypothetical protein [Alishewanella sp. HL-SH05]|uniref:hypothetical protein n=1 Tax=Alishewanella sp. HL-SH05 TaxID=3461145 RepID=UPI0040435DC8
MSSLSTGNFPVNTLLRQQTVRQAELAEQQARALETQAAAKRREARQAEAAAKRLDAEANVAENEANTLQQNLNAAEQLSQSNQQNGERFQQSINRQFTQNSTAEPDNKANALTIEINNLVNGSSSEKSGSLINTVI